VPAGNQRRLTTPNRLLAEGPLPGAASTATLVGEHSGGILPTEVTYASFFPSPRLPACRARLTGLAVGADEGQGSFSPLASTSRVLPSA